MMLDRIERAVSTPAPPFAAERKALFRAHPDGAAVFAAACASLPGARVLQDVALDEVSLSFGSRTEQVHDHLHRLGCRVALSDWGDRKVLRFAFGGRSFGDGVARELAGVIRLALAEMHVADTRAW